MIRENSKRKSISEIKQELEQADIESRKELLEIYKEDSRAGVVSLLAKYRKQEQKLREERERLFRMSSYEREYRDFSYICGIDEVGRGPLAGRGGSGNPAKRL